jgi:hypothetical protein
MPPPPPDAASPLLWGNEEHVRDLLGDRVELLKTARMQYIERAPTPSQYVTLFKEAFGPVVALYQSLADQPERATALDQDFLEYARRANAGPPEGPAEYRYDYLLVIARKRTQDDA